MKIGSIYKNKLSVESAGFLSGKIKGSFHYREYLNLGPVFTAWLADDDLTHLSFGSLCAGFVYTFDKIPK